MNIGELRLAPLRERIEDIPALVASFNAHFSARHGRRPKTFTPEFLAAVARHPWPGNIRQLRNLIERLVVTVRTAEIDVDHAPPPPATAPTARDALFSVPPRTSFAEVEARLIRETFACVTRNRREAAQILGISPRALAYKVKALGIQL